MLGSRYLENEVLSADPIGLVHLLYEGAIQAIVQAQQYLAEGRIPERSNAITKAMQIVAELQGSLDLERGGEIARRLADLYAYVQDRLIQGNAERNLQALDDALETLTILHQGWKEISAPARSQTAGPETEPIEAGSMSWTL